MENRERDRVSQRDTPTEAGELNRHVEEEKGREKNQNADFGQKIGQAEKLAIDVPVLNMTGTCDIGLIWRTFPKHRRIPFERSHAPNQYLVTLDRVNHDSFVIEDKARDAIVSITIAFLRAHLRGDDAARAWFDDAGRGEVAHVGISVERKNGSAR
jgi:hypothetical protein